MTELKKEQPPLENSPVSSPLSELKRHRTGTTNLTLNRNPSEAIQILKPNENLVLDTIKSNEQVESISERSKEDEGGYSDDVSSNSIICDDEFSKKKNTTPQKPKKNF